MDVCVTRLWNEGGMPFRVDSGFVDPRVQGGDIDVMDLLVGGDLMVQFHRIGTSSTESVARIQVFCTLKVSYKRTDVKGVVFEAGPTASPHFHHGVPLGAKPLSSLLGSLVDILHGAITVAQMYFVTVGVTASTSMPETAVKFVDSVGSGIETVHIQVGTRDAILAGIFPMLNMGDLMLLAPG